MLLYIHSKTEDVERRKNKTNKKSIHKSTKTKDKDQEKTKKL